MAVYSAEQRMRPGEKTKPTEGVHVMSVKKEMQNSKMQSQHSFLLTSEKHECWFNCFVTDLDAFAEACGVKVDAAAPLDTSLLVGKNIQVKYGKKLAKNGNEYDQVLEYAPAPQPNVSLEDLPF